MIPLSENYNNYNKIDCIIKVAQSKLVCALKAS